MSLKQTVSAEQQAGYWLILLRVAWCIVAGLSAGLVAASVLTAGAFLHALHTAALCGNCAGRLSLQAERVVLAAERWKVLAIAPWLDGYILYISILCILCALSYLVVAGVLVWRKPNDRMALFAAFFFVLLAVTFCSELPMLPSFWSLLPAQATYLGTTCLFLFFCLFPAGRFVPWWSYCLAAVAVLHYGMYAFFSDSPLNPFAHSELFKEMVESSLVAGIALLQVYRYKRVSDPVQRRQTKWVVFGGCSAAILYLAQQLFTHLVAPQLSSPLTALIISDTVFFISLLLIPLSIGVAILRSRLWNIDIIIHRTLVYGTLSACVVGLYVLVVGGLGIVLQGQGNVLISLLATGLIAVLFHPLRERLQRAVNYLVYGERNDPYQVLSRLSRRLETTLVPDEVLSTIVETVAQAFKLPYAAITLKQGEQFAPGAVYGQAGQEEALLHLTLTGHGEVLGELILTSDPQEMRFLPRTGVCWRISRVMPAQRSTRRV